MKHSFKRFLSSALATVVAVSTMSFGMVSEVFAADYSDNVSVTTTSTTKTWDFTANPPAASINLKADDTVDDITIVTIASTKLHNSGYFTTKAGSAISIAVPANSKGTLTLIANGNQSARYATLEGQNIIMASGAGNSATFTADETADGDLDVTFAGGEFKLITAIVTLTTGSFGEVATYTLTGSVSGLEAGTVFELTDGAKSFNATVNADGATYTVTTQSGAFDTTATYTASLANYTASYEGADGVTVTATDGTNFVASNAITFEKAPLSAIAAGTYTYSNVEAGLPNFETALTGSGGKYTGTIKLVLSDTATITVNGKCGSSTTTKNASVILDDATLGTSNGGDSAADYTATNVAAGEHTITLTDNGTSTTFQLVSITVTYGAAPIESSTESTTEAIESTTEATESTTEATESTTEAVVATPVITDKATLTPSETIATLAEDTVYGQFILMNGLSVEANNKSIDGFADYSYRIKSNGKTKFDATTGAPTYRAIMFTTAGPATLQVVAMSGSSSAEREYDVYNSEGVSIGNSFVSGTDCVTSAIYTLPAADTYYIACPDAACNFYSVNVVVGAGLVDSNDEQGTIFADTTDAYMIAGVSSDDLANDTIAISANGQTSEADTVVYESAMIDGHLIYANQLGYEYLYVVKAVNAVANNALDAVKDFTRVLTNAQ